MIKTIDTMSETVLVLQPGVKITIETDDNSKVKFLKKPIEAVDNFAEQELNMLKFLHTIPRLQYLDKVVNMYIELDKEHRIKVVNQLEWTKYKTDFFIRDFIRAVNTVCEGYKKER
jgi:hypothetical protein